MPPFGQVRPVVRVLSTSLATATVALAVAWPRVTIADAGDGASAQAEPGTKLGTVVVQGTVSRDPGTSHWTVHLHAHNRGDATASFGLRAGLTRTVFDPSNRGEPTPATLWRDDTSIELGPGETSDATFDVPDKVAERMTHDADRPPRWHALAMGAPGTGGYVSTVYDVVVFKRTSRAGKANEG